ncbi:MAG: preprotein translocase subunit SecE [Syntrophobacteraceae bacterium]|nr:preprotein translocase subunit SecE [Desulfobacteraceae bacterium]
MDLPKLFPKKSKQGGEQSAGAQKSDVLKRIGPKAVKVRKPEPAKKVAKKPEEAAPAAWWNTFRQYLREVVSELRKVIWPSRKETLGTTSVVLVIVILCAVYLGVADAILSRLVRIFVG